jgi:imidazolonepropionase-like amidohydrolase
MHTPSFFRWLLLLGTLFVFTSVAVAQSGDLAITHVTIINPGTGKPQPDMTIVIRGHDIVSVAPAKGFKLSSSTKVINGTGKVVIPGLWDMHTHFRDADRDL